MELVRFQTPMLRQYADAKAAHPGVLLAMRIGDFYEFYGEDAEIAAKALEITLTGREDGTNGRVPMAGVPFHSVEKYLVRLLRAGHKVALCDQVEDPKTAKGLVKREVTRVLTPGTVVEDSMLPDRGNNFLAALCVLEGVAGLAVLDSSTGEFLVTQLDSELAGERVLQELARLQPSELLVSPQEAEHARVAQDGLGIAVTEVGRPTPDRATRRLLEHFEVSTLGGFGVEERSGAAVAAAMVLDYARHAGLELRHVRSMSAYSVDSFMKLDPSARRSLEITQNIADGTRRHTLVSVLDESVTSMGSRLMRRWLEQPLLDLAAIQARQDAVERLIEHALTRGDLREAMRKLADIERLVSRASTGLASPRDLVALKDSLLALPDFEDALRKVALGRLHELREMLGRHEDLALTLKKALVDEPPHTLRDGGVIRQDHDMELDQLRGLSRNGKQYIAELEQKERRATGIDKLKVGFNSVFGYYLEVPKSVSHAAPPGYIRKQTTAGAERYITAELKDHESAVLGAEEKAIALEADLFGRLRKRVAEHSSALLQTARAVAEADVLASLAEVSVRRRYCRPKVVEQDVLEVVEGRHPVVESASSSFVPNDLALGTRVDGPRCIILTGPNMSGKSTYLRQTALIALMAQVGSFVPASSCVLGLCDRIFTRIGARDEIALGQSTFMVEMVECSSVLNAATERSLVILDEVGRGTSTFDGLAIAWAMVEHLAAVGAKTLFATHYHQLNGLAEQVPGIANFRVSVEEFGEQVVWTHRVLPGGTDRSYGVQVARMAGVPPSVLARAGEVLAQLESVERGPAAVRPSEQRVQLTLFELEDSPVVEELKGLDVERLTPVQALLKLDEWKRRFGR